MILQKKMSKASVKAKTRPNKPMLIIKTTMIAMKMMKALTAKMPQVAVTMMMTMIPTKMAPNPKVENLPKNPLLMKKLIKMKSQ
jgi:hypothetical protein